MNADDYSLVEDKAPWDDIVANYDDEQLIKEGNVKDVTFLSLSAKEDRTEQEQALYTKLKTSIYRAIVLNSTDDKDKYGGHWGNEIESDYYFSETRRYNGRTFSDWKIHLDVKPTPKDPVTKEISEFLKTLDVEHKIAHGGIEGKGMTIYTGSYADTRRLSRVIYERFHDKMKLPPIYDNITNEHFFNPYCFGRFQDGGQPFPMEYPAHTSVATGISGLPSFSRMVGDLVDKELDDYACIKLCHLYVKNANKNGFNLPDSPARDVWRSPYYKDRRSKISNDDHILFHTLASYSLHKLWADELGDFYHGGDLDKFEKIFFKGYLPEKGTPEREKWDKTAEANIKIIRENCGDRLQLLKDKVAHYIPIDFSRIEENTNQPQIQNLENTQQQPVTQPQQTSQDRQHPAANQSDTQNTGRTTMAQYSNNTNGFQNQEQLFRAFHEMGEAQYSTGQVSDEEMQRFFAAKEDYIRNHPEERVQINTDIERFLNNDLENGRESQTEMFGGFTYTFDEAFHSRYNKNEEEYLKTLPPFYENRDQLFIAFHEMGEAQYETGQVSDEEVTRFIAAKEDYIRRHPQEKERINADIERFLNNDLENGRESQTEMFGGFTYTFDEAFRNRYHKLEDDYLKTQTQTTQNPPIQQTLKEDSVVPDLAQSVLQMGFNNRFIRADLEAAIRNLPDGHERDMFLKVLEAYEVSMSERAQKVVALNDLVVTEEDVEIARHITKALGWDEGDYPEMHKDIEVATTIYPPSEEDEKEDNSDDGNGGDGNEDNSDDGNGGDGNEDNSDDGNGGDGNDDNSDDGNGGGGAGGGGSDDGSDDNDDWDDDRYEEILGRLRSAESDTNENKVDFISYNILRSMNKVRQLTAAEQADEDILYNTVQDAVNNLSDEENRKFNDEFADAVALNQQILIGVPPSVLAKAYMSYNARIAAKEYEILNTNDAQKKQQLNNERDDLLRKKDNIAERIDELTDMLVADTHDDKDLFFADDTNVADVYDGYQQMFDVRIHDLQSQQNANNPNPVIADRIKKMKDGQQALDAQYDSYLNTYGLDKVNKNSAEALNNRYNEIEKGLAKVGLDDTTAMEVVTQNSAGQDVTLGALLSSVRFYDENKNIEPQFIDKDGNQLTDWKPGARVIEGSKLDQTISMAKQLFVQDNLASNSPLKDEDFKKAITEYVPQMLYATNVKSLIAQNILETPDQYKDRQTIDRNVAEFVKLLGDSNRPMVVDDHVFTNVKNSIVNQAYAYRGVLAKQLGVSNDDNIDKTPILHKVCNNVKPLDARPSSRQIKTVTPNVWRNYASETLQGMAAAAIGTARVKGAQLVAIGAAHAATGIATAQLALAASAVVPAVLTIKQIHSWNKERKAEGKPFKWKNFIKEMGPTLGVTALTEAAVGCMFIPGGQPVGIALGVAALGIGVSRAAANDYKKLRTAGKSKWKAGLAAAVGAGLKIGTAILVNKAMTDFFNNHFGSKVEHKDGETRTETRTEIRESAELQAGARQTLENFYKGNPEGLQHDLEQVRAQLHAMGRDDISPEVFLRNACDAGMNTGTDTINHVDGGGIVHTNGNNLVLTDEWAPRHGVDVNAVHALGGIKAPDGTITITDDALKGFYAVREHISTANEVGSFFDDKGSRLAGHQDGVLGRNAMVNDGGRTVHAPQGQGTEFNTYADGKNGYMEYTITKTITTPGGDVNTPINYDAPMAVGMLGIRNGGWIHKMTKRVGTWLDRIVGHKKPEPRPDPRPNPEPDPVPVPPNPKPKPVPAPQPQQVDVVKINMLLNEEYQMLHGYKPTQDDKQYQAYCERTRKEFENKPEFNNMLDFLKERKERMNAVVCANANETNIAKTIEKDVLHNGGYSKVEKAQLVEDFTNKRATAPLTAAIRQDFWKSNNKTAKEWSFEDLIAHAPEYMKQTTKEAVSRDNKKAALRRENNEPGKANRFKTKGERE